MNFSAWAWGRRTRYRRGGGGQPGSLHPNNDYVRKGLALSLSLSVRMLIFQLHNTLKYNSLRSARL